MVSEKFFFNFCILGLTNCNPACHTKHTKSICFECYEPSNIKTEVNLKGGAPHDAIPFPAMLPPQFQKRTNEAQLFVNFSKSVKIKN